MSEPTDSSFSLCICDAAKGQMVQFMTGNTELDVAGCPDRVKSILIIGGRSTTGTSHYRTLAVSKIARLFADIEAQLRTYPESGPSTRHSRQRINLGLQPPRINLFKFSANVGTLTKCCT